MRWGGGEVSSNYLVLLKGEFLIGLSAEEPASGRSILFIVQILQKFVEEEENSLEGTAKSNSNGPQGFMS